MLRRLILIWLISSVFGYGIAVAFDHHDDVPSQQHEQMQSTEHSSHGHNDSNDDSTCGHCSHSAAHLLGLPHTVSVAIPDSRSQQLHSNSLFGYSISPPALLRPPIQA